MSGLSFDPEIEAAVRAFFAAGDEIPAIPERGDAIALRESVDGMMAATKSATTVSPNVTSKILQARANDGTTLDLHWYTRNGADPGSAVLYIHGGGMICGSVPLCDAGIKEYVDRSGVPFLAVEYRLAPEHPHPIPVEDCYSGLAWLIDHAADLGVDPKRIAVLGESAGGGIAAGVALLARDRGTSLARQILIYPMLDDRTLEPEEALLPFVNWNYDNNFTGWSALLGPTLGSETVPPSAAPARADDLRGLAPAYIEVGELDIFEIEDIDYARKLALAGVSIELHVHPGAPHGFERIAPNSNLSARAITDRCRVLASL